MKNFLLKEKNRAEGRRAAPWMRTGFLLTYFTAIVYLTTGYYGSGCADDLPLRLLGPAVVEHGTLYLDEFREELTTIDGRLQHDVIEHDGHVLSIPPPATGALSVPFYLVVRALRGGDPVAMSMVSAKLAASVMSAASVGLVYATLRRLGAPKGTGIGLAGVYALGTPVFSIASQSLCQHPAATLAIAASLYCVVRTKGESSFSALSGLALGAAVAIRPQMALIALPLIVLLIFRYPPISAILIASAAVFPAMAAVYNLAAFDRITGGYGLAFAPGGDAGIASVPSSSMLPGLAGLLVSPGRGLFLFVPVALFSIGGIAKSIRGRDWLMISGAIAAVLTLLLRAKLPVWWGGHTYGPRTLTEIMPILTLLQYRFFQGFHAEAVRKWLVPFVFAAFASVIIQVIGAYGQNCSWNHLPVSVDQRPERNWDWGDTQISRCASEFF